MKKYLKQFLTSFFLILLISCQNTSLKTKPDIIVKIKKEITLDDSTSNLLHSIYPIASGSKSSEIIAIPNKRNPVSVILMNYDGKLIDEIGSEGRGPDEIQSARYIGFDNENNVVVIDKALALIKKFDRKTKGVKSYDLFLEDGIDITSTNLEECDDKWFVGINKYKGMPNDTTDIIGVLNKDFKLIKTFGNFDPFFKGNKSIFQDPAISVDCENKLLFTTHWKVPFVQVYDLNDYSLQKRIDEIPPSFRLSDKFIDYVSNIDAIREFTVNEQSLSIFIGHTNKYIILPFRNNSLNFFETRNYADRTHYIAVYSRDDYSLIGEYQVQGVLLGMTKEGYLISLINDNPENLTVHLLEITTEKEDG